MSCSKMQRGPFREEGQPERGFGKVWREWLGGADSTNAWVGWATKVEHGLTMLAQECAGALLLKGENNLVYVLYTDGTWQTNSE